MSALCPLVLVFFCASGDAPDSLPSRLLPLAKTHRGKVAIALVHLKTRESYYLNADEPMPTASLIKLAVMVEVFQQAAEGKVKLTEPITLRPQDLENVGGSGVLKYCFTPGVTFPLRDAVRLMIAVSDNVATNLVLDRIGIASTAKRMEAWGYPNTKIHSKSFLRNTSVFPERSKRFGLGSTSAREMTSILEKLYEGKLVSPEASKEMLAILKECTDTEKFPRFLPSGTLVQHKTGSVNDARTDAGIINFPGGPVALCVLTAENIGDKEKLWTVDNEGNVFCARVARIVYDHFRSKK